MARCGPRAGCRRVPGVRAGGGERLQSADASHLRSSVTRPVGGQRRRQAIVGRAEPPAGGFLPRFPGMRATDSRAPWYSSLLAVALSLSLGLLAGCTSGSAVASPTTPTAYVATGASVANPGNTVAVVDTVTAKAQKPITTDTLPAALAVTPGGSDVLVANKGTDTVSEIDVASGTVVRQVTVGLEPDGVAVT